MRVSLIVFGLSLAFVSKGQIDLDKAPWKNLPCEKGETQYEMNVCSGKKVAIADSVMNVIYNQILTKLEDDLKRELAIKNPDQYELEFIKNIKNSINLLKKSQQDYDVYKKSIEEFISEQYSGGTIRPLMRNLWGLSLIEDRIKLLNNLIQEFK